MAIDLKERAPVARTTELIPSPVGGTRRQAVATWLLVAVLMGVAGGAVAYSLAAAGDQAERAARIQARRAEATVEAYERSWPAVQSSQAVRFAPAPSIVWVTGTGPGLVTVAELQAAWAEHAITGTGPGLVTVAELQAGSAFGAEPTGTGPGLERLPGPAGSNAAVIGTP
jgi:hypothetical protein